MGVGRVVWDEVHERSDEEPDRERRTALSQPELESVLGLPEDSVSLAWEKPLMERLLRSSCCWVEWELVLLWLCRLAFAG